MRCVVGVFFGLLLVIPLTVSADAPPAPGHLSAASAAPGQVTLSWPGVAGASEYRVYRGLEPQVRVDGDTWSRTEANPPVAVTASTSFTDTGLSQLVRYYYTVTAVKDGVESGPAPANAFAMVIAAANAPILGIADLHNHQFANLGFGEKMFWGAPFHEEGIQKALDWCTQNHGLGGIGDLVGMALGQGFGHAVGGSPQFDGWPKWNTYTHQQVYYEWLERAFLGGVKLMVMHAVNNEVLCGAVSNNGNCNDMAAVDRQIAAAKHLEAHVDWYRIAYSADHARQIINSGKMAVVLGIEVDQLFDCRLTGGCDDARVKHELGRYYAMGVRHFFPIHVFDNGFGGAALYNDAFNIGNKKATGQFLAARDCGADGYRFKLGGTTGLATWLNGLFGYPLPAATNYAGDCNASGLTPLGESVIRKMMSRKAIIDIDHLSALATDTTLSMAEGFDYPVVAGHTGFMDTSVGSKRSEGQKTDAQMNRIRNLGGMVAPIFHQGTKFEIVGVAGGPVPNDCSNSSKTWAQAYRYAASKMAGGRLNGAVGIGTDFNGLAGQPGPRFGGDRCGGDNPLVPQGGGVGYPFAPHGKPGVIHRAVIGERTFDFNVDGMAHMGMIPDFVEDLKSLGMSDDDLRPLYSSAEAYIQMWKRAEELNIYPPSLALSLSPAANANGWHKGDATVNASATESADGWPITGITYTMSGAQAGGPSTVAGSTAAAVVSAEGTTAVSLSARDDAANHDDEAVTVRVDKSMPNVTCATPDGAWHATDVQLPCTAGDLVSGLAQSADASFTLATSVPAGTETANASTESRTVTDLADNATTVGPISGNKVDKKAPAIAITAPVNDAVYILNQPVAAGYACSDGGSGVATCSGPVPSGAHFETTGVGIEQFSVDATDNVANASTAGVSYKVAFNVCVLYDQTKAVRSGAVVPVKLQLCDYAGANVSNAEIVVNASGVHQVSTVAVGAVQDAGQANPDDNFRFAGDAYIFNLKTTALGTGTYELRFTATGDPTTHVVRFQVR
jgi:microsomal dipeptidase-like Zn-dependent dipeptidase